jgi:hypothetical protein
LRHALRKGLIALVAALASAAAACSLLLDTSPEQCTTSSDCDKRGGAFVGLVCANHVCVAPEAGADGGTDAEPPVEAGPWSCLGNVPIPEAGTSDVSVVVPLVDLTTKSAVTAGDVFARICAKIDVNCNKPLSNGDAGVIVSPDAKGLLNLTLPSGFDGFVLIDPIVPSSDAGSPDSGADAAPPPDVFVPSLVFFNPPIYGNLVYTTIVMVKTSELGQIAAVEQTTLDPSLGAVFMETVDCDFKPAAGVSVTIDSTSSTTQGFYFKGGLPALNAPSTDTTGYAGFVNVPKGTPTVTGKLEATQQKIGSATVFTQASTISYTVMAPSP